MVKVYFFTSQSCSACKQMYPLIRRLKNEGVNIEEVDVNQRYELARKYNVSALPTIVVLQNDKEIKRHVGVVAEDTLRKSLRPTTPDYKIW